MDNKDNRSFRSEGYNNIDYNPTGYNNIDYNPTGYNNIDYNTVSDNGNNSHNYNNSEETYHERDLKNKDNFEGEFNHNLNDHFNSEDNFDNRDNFNYQDSLNDNGDVIKRENEENKNLYHMPESPRMEIPRIEIPRAEVPRVEVSREEIPREEVPRVEVSREKMRRTETPRIGVPRAEVSEKESKKRKGMGFAKVAVLLIISCAVLGLGLGFGYKWGESYFASNLSEQNAPVFEGNVDGANVISSESPTNSQEVEQSGLNHSDVAKAINNPLNGSVSLANIAENTKKAVVAITSHEITRNYIMGEVEVPTSGTGIVYQMTADKIYIVTNSHVVGEGETSVKFEHQNEPVDVEFIGRDEVTDVAVLSVNKSDVNAEALAYIKPIKFADSDKVRVGDFVMVVGNPLGYDYTTTFGIVSGLNRNTQLTSEDLLIQVDAAVNRGNSGGPLVNMAGELIGVINQKMNTLTAEGIGFAIPANRVMEDIKYLVENKENPTTSQAFLGITGEAIDESASEYYKLPLGVLVRTTLKGAAAQTGGIKEGDIIIEVDGKKITNMVELQRIVSRKKPNEEINVKVFRVQDGELMIKVRLSDKSKFKLNRE